MKYLEGDFVENYDGAFFDVKGHVHPPSRAVAFIRYFPSEKGDRKKTSLGYDKVYSFSERYSLLKEKYPHYLVRDAVFDEVLCEVPDREIKKRYRPVEKMMQLRRQSDLDSLEKKAVQFAENLRSISNVPWNAIGISGSILIGLHKISSDLDPVVYGSENCRKAHSALQEIMKKDESFFKPYSVRELKSLFDFRSKDTVMGFEQFLRTESKKAYQGKFMGTDYFVRFIKDWEEVDEKYGDIQYKNVGHAKIQAVVADDSESIFTPCRYVICDAVFVEGPKVEPIREVASFRGRFCDQARKGDSIVAQGKVERVMNQKEGCEYLRLLIGNERSDYMVVV
jgi:predicted nucleotidyltransferase